MDRRPHHALWSLATLGVALIFGVSCGVPSGSLASESVNQRTVTEGSSPTKATVSKDLDLAQTIPVTSDWATASTTLRRGDFSSAQEGRAQSSIWSWGSTWSVFANASGVGLYRLRDRTWTLEMQLSTQVGAKPSVAVRLNMVHVATLLNNTASVGSLRYDTTSKTYRWATPTMTSVALGTNVEVVSMAVDSLARLWLVSDSGYTIAARVASSPYTSFSAPTTIANGVSGADIAGVVALPNKSIGVFWSNSINKTFGFRTRLDSSATTTWNATSESPGNGANPTVGLGIADSQFNLAVAKNGRVFAAVKTRYSKTGYPQIGLLTRSAAGVWSPITMVDSIGARPAIALDEVNGIVRVVYVSAQIGGDLLMKEAPIENPVFSDRRVLANGTLTNPTLRGDTGDGNGLVEAFDGARGIGVMLNTVKRDTEVVVTHDPLETPAATTARLQGLIDKASKAGAGLRFPSNKTFTIAGSLNVTFPGPRYIDGGYSILTGQATSGAVLNVESAQDGLVIRDLNILASDGTYVEDKAKCSVAWAHHGAAYGIVLGNTRWATIRSVVVWHAAVAGIKIEPTIGENEGTLIEASNVRYSSDALQIIGTAGNPVRSTQLLNTTLHFTRNNAATVRFADDLRIHGGSLERTHVDLLRIEDSNRVQALTYLENFGGYLKSSTTNDWCPRSGDGNSVDLLRSANVLVRGRNGEEKDRSPTVGPAVAATSSTCYRVVSRDIVLGGTCGVSAIARPVTSSRYENVVADAHLGDPVDILPADSMATVMDKMATAATAGVGVRLQPAATYYWTPIALKFKSRTPAYIDGRGARINLQAVSTIAPAALRFGQPYGMSVIGQDRFSIQNLVINVGNRAQYGILLEVGNSATVRGVTIYDPTMAGIRADTTTAGGIYYHLFADCVVRRAPIGIQILTVDGATTTRRAGANMVDNFNGIDVATVYDLSWASSTLIANSNNSYTSAFVGNKLLMKGEGTTDVEFLNTLFDNTTPSDAVVVKLGWKDGYYYDLAR